MEFLSECVQCLCIAGLLYGLWLSVVASAGGVPAQPSTPSRRGHHRRAGCWPARPAEPPPAG